MARKDDRLDVTVTQLEITERPTRPPSHAPMTPHPLSLMRAHEPTVSFYRYLYDTVGEPWLWYERRKLDKAALATVIGNEQVEIFVLSVGGVPAGFAEIDTRREMNQRSGDVLLAYFGLVPEYIGRGFGRFFLEAVIDIAWDRDTIERLVVRTCTLDHPAALPLYQRCGFTATGQQRTSIPDPRKNGLLPPDAGPEGIWRP